MNLLTKTLLTLVVLIGGLVLAFNSFKSRSEILPVEVKTFKALKSSGTSWEQVFKNPAPVRVESIDTGRTTAKVSKLLNFKHPNAKELEDDKRKLLVLSHLIYHEKFGHYLVDAGLDSMAQKSPYGSLKGIMVKNLVFGYSQEKGMDAASQLKEKCVVPKGILLTHLHFDHTAGLLDLPKNIPCYMGKNEKYWNYKFLYESDYLKGFNDLYQFDFSHAEFMDPLGPALDIFGDGSVWAVSTPGHTEGHVSYLINGNEGPVLVAGDASPVKYGIESGIGPGTYSSDVKAAQLTFNKIVEFHKKYPEVKILFGHELP